MCRQRGFEVDSGIVVTSSTNGGFSKLVPLPASSCFECHTMTGNFVISYSYPGFFGTCRSPNEKCRVVLVQSRGYLLIYVNESKSKGFLLDLKQAKKVGFVSARKSKKCGNASVEACSNKSKLIYSFGTMKIDFLNNIESMRWMLALTAVHGGTQILTNSNPKIWSDGHLMFNPDLFRTTTDSEPSMMSETKSESEVGEQDTSDQTFVVKTLSNVSTSISTESMKSSTNQPELNLENGVEKLKEVASNSSHPPTPVIFAETRALNSSDSDTAKNSLSVLSCSDILERNVFESDIDFSGSIAASMDKKSTASLSSVLSEATERTILQQKMTEELKQWSFVRNEKELTFEAVSVRQEETKQNEPELPAINENKKAERIFDRSTMFPIDDELTDTVGLINRGLMRAADIFSAKMPHEEANLNTVSSGSSWKDVSPRTSMRLSEPVPNRVPQAFDVQRSRSLKTSALASGNFTDRPKEEPGKTLSQSYSGSTKTIRF